MERRRFVHEIDDADGDQEDPAPDPERRHDPVLDVRLFQGEFSALGLAGNDDRVLKLDLGAERELLVELVAEIDDEAMEVQRSFPRSVRLVVVQLSVPSQRRGRFLGGGGGWRQQRHSRRDQSWKATVSHKGVLALMVLDTRTVFLDYRDRLLYIE